MFGVREINKKDNGFPTLYENVSDNIRFNKISNYKSNTGNSYCEANNSKMLAKISSNETCEEQQQNDYNSSNSDDNNDYENLWHRNNSNLKKVTELNSPCKLAVSSPDDRKSNFTTTSNSSYHTNCKLERSRSDSPVQFTVMVQQQLQKKESHLNLNNSDNHQTDDENNENFLSDDDDDNDEDDGDDDSTDSEFSDLSGLSDISGQDWKPMAKPINWVQKQIHLGADPREILSQILSNGTMIAPDLNDMTLWRILANILSEPPRRPKLKNINTINDVVKLLKTSKNIIVLTGAGVSVSCGIPDFRSNNGIYNRLAKDFPDLPDPQAMFDINYFSKDPRPFYKFAREIYPGQFTPSPCHRFIKLLEKKHKLLRNYTQNIDTLEQVAGIKNVIECHGSFATASCTKCKYKTTADAIRDDIFAQRIPICPKCQKSNNQSETAIMANDNNYEFGQINKTPSYSEIVQNGIMKPDIVFFGEGLPDAFHTAMASDKDHCDLLIVIGSSLKVRPVALIPSSIPPNVPQILINREQLNHLEFDVELLGDSDVIINHLCHLLGNDWEEICWNSTVLHETKHLKPKSNNTDVSLSSSIIDDDIKSHTISDFSSSSKSDNLIIDGSNSPFCDSGFDSSSSHPVYNISLSKDNQQQLQHQHQQHQYYQHQNQQSQQLIKGNFHQNSSIPQQSSSSFPCLVSSSSSLSSFESSSMNNDENEKNILFDLKTKQKSNSNNANIQDDQANNEKLFLSSKSSRNKSIDSLKDGNDTCDTLNNKPVSLTLSGTNILNNSNNCNDNFYHNYRNHSDNNCSNSPLHHNNDKNNFIDNKNSNQHFYNDNNDDGGNPNIGTTEHHHVWSSNNKQQTSSSIPSSNSLFVTSATSSSSSASSIINVKSIAERLLENSYYCHSKKCAYVFPGAQIFWNSDSEDDNDEDDDDGSDDCEDNDNDDDEKEGVAIDNNCENSRDNDVECNDKVENHCIDSDDTITSSSSDDDDDYDNDNKLSKTPNLIYNNVEKISENKSNHNSNNYDINNENIDNDDVPPNKRRRE